MHWSELSRKDISLAQSDVDDAWSAGDAVLYRLCAEHPAHREHLQVVAKLWLIGRAYSAAIERRPTSRDPKPLAVKEYYLRVAGVLIKSDIDAQLSSLRDYPRTLEDLLPALAAHKSFVVSLRSISHIDHYSFASKYLHFHQPNWFFIIDSVARSGLSRLGVRSRARLPKDFGHNKYRRFVARAWSLREDLVSAGHSRLSLRELDRRLLRWGAS